MRVTRSAAKRAATTPTETSSAPLISPQSKKQRTTKNSQPANSSQPAYYLFKSEPESRIQNGHEMKYSIDDLSEEKDAITHWDGVRNAEARNCMLGMHVGDFGFFYHSNTKKSRPAIVGIVKVVKEAYPDHTAFDKNDPHYDPKSSEENPRWKMVDVQFVRKFPREINLDEIKASKQLSNMQLVKRGRISVQSVKKEEWDHICELAEKDPPKLNQPKTRTRQSAKK